MYAVSRYALRLLAVILLSAIMIPVDAQADDSRYWYVISTSVPNIVIFRTVDPANPADSEIAFQLNLPENTGLSDAVLSPDGVWVALAVGYGPRSGVLVVNLETRETQFTGGIFLNERPHGSMDPSRHLLTWSPNSQMVAFHLFELNNPQSESRLAVYDVVRQQLFNLNSGDTNQHNFVWFPDSQHLAVVTSSQEQQQTWFELFDTTTWIADSQLSFDPLVNGVASGTTFCQFNISPDASYASFWFPCEGGAFEFPKEVFVLDLNTGTIQQVTEISDPRQHMEVQMIYYTLKWLQDGDLLIGASYKTITRQGAETFRFNPSSGQLITVDDTFSMLDQAINPVTGEVAVLEQKVRHWDGESELAVVSLEHPDKEALQLASVDSCQLSWSLSGETIAYLVIRSYCDSPSVRAIGFIDPATGEQGIHAVPEDRYAIALGWR